MMLYPANAPRLYVEASLAEQVVVTPTLEQIHYLTNVLRLQTNASVRVFNATDGEWQSIIVLAGKKSLGLLPQVRIGITRLVPPLTLLCAPIKRAYFDFIITKATELGVSAIQPILTSRTQIRDVNLNRCRSVAIEAAEQSERTDIPHIYEPVTLDRILDTWPVAALPLICAEFGSAAPIYSALVDSVFEAGDEPYIIVGPEGGFTPDEMSSLQNLPRALALRLGPRILRADTAALAAITCWQATRGDWRQPVSDVKITHV